MKYLVAGLALMLSFSAGAEQTTGQRIKSDAKAMAHQAKDAAVDAGHQIRDGSKKAYRGARNKMKGDVKDMKAGRDPGDGRYAAREEARAKSQQGRK